MGETAGNGTARQLEVLLRAKYVLLGIRSREERRVEALIRATAARLREPERGEPYRVRYWSATRGLTTLDEQGREVPFDEDSRDPEQAVEAVLRAEERALYVFRDLHPYLRLESWAEAPRLIRCLRDAARQLRRTPPQAARAVILLGPVLEVPRELETELYVLDWPLPDRDTLRVVVEETLKGIRDPEVRAMAEAADREAVVEAALGLTADQAYGALARSLVQHRTLSPAAVVEEKRQIIARTGCLEWVTPRPGAGLGAIGGWERFKRWARLERLAFSEAARAWGLDAPKGVLVYGLPGNGKSAMFEALAADWGLPAVRLVVARLFGALLGETEERFQTVKETLRVLAPCLVFIDEIDKALGGEGGELTGGTAGRFRGEFLTWLQEEPRVPIWRYATANNIELLAERSPELVRAGRWDEQFFVDLPTPAEAEAILRVHVERRRCQANFAPDLDLRAVAAQARSFSGAELEGVVRRALRVAFADGARPVTTGDLLDAARATTPLATLARPRIQALRRWAAGRGAQWVSEQTPEPEGEAPAVV